MRPLLHVSRTSVCGALVSCAKTDKPTEMLFGGTRVSTRNLVDLGKDPPRAVRDTPLNSSTATSLRFIEINSKGPLNGL